MKRKHVLLVEPDAQRRVELARALALDFHVSTVCGIGDAVRTFLNERPDVVAASMDLEHGNGIRLCRWLRTKTGGDACVMLVLGNPGQRLRSGAELRRVWQVDGFVPYQAGPQCLATVITLELTLRASPSLECVAGLEQPPRDQGLRAGGTWWSARFAAIKARLFA